MMTPPLPWAVWPNALQHFLGKDCPNTQSIFPDVRQGHLFHPVTFYLGEDIDPNPTTTSFQLVVGSNKVFPEPTLLQVKHSLGHLALLNHIQLPLAHWASLLRTFCRALLPSSRSTLPTNLVLPVKRNNCYHLVKDSHSAQQYPWQRSLCVIQTTVKLQVLNKTPSYWFSTSAFVLTSTNLKISISLLS